MPTVGSTARVTMAGLKREGVTLSSPLEDQVSLVYRAAYAHGLMNGFRYHVHRGVPGIMGRMVMARIVHTLFTGSEDELMHSKQLIYQVLRRTDAAVCLRNTGHGGPGYEQMPEWFIANSMPENLTIVALHIGRKSAGGAALPSGYANEDQFLRDSEKKLTAKEAGEDHTPGEVTVTRAAQQLTPETMSRRDRAFEEARRRKAEEHKQILETVYEHVATSSQPVTAADIEVFLMRDGQPRNKTTILNCLRELHKAGRVVGRKETKDEAKVRGGGEAPKATRPFLWGPGNSAVGDQVPTRTALPAGIEPQQSARAAAQRKAEHDILVEDAVLDVLSRPYPKGTSSRPRSSGKIAELTPYSQDEVRSALTALCAKDKIYRAGKGTYYLTDRKRGAYNLPDKDAQPQGEVVTAGQGVSASTGPSAETLERVRQSAATAEEISRDYAARDVWGVDNETLVSVLAERLGVPLAPDTNQELMAANARIETLEAENDRLRKQLDQIRGALSSLS